MRPDTRSTTGNPGAPAATGPMHYWVHEPVEGVWEVRLQDVEDTRTFDWQQAKLDSAVPPTAVTVTVTALGVDVASSAQAAGDGGSAAGALTLTNRFGTFSGAAVGLPMGAARRERVELSPRQQRLFEIDVPAGSPWLVARTRGARGVGGDVDLYLFDCTGKACVAARADGDGSADEVVMVRQPAAGKWKVIVDHPGKQQTPIAVDYEDIVFNPAFGFVAVTDQPAERGVGTAWTTSTNRWIAGTLPDGRSAYPAIGLQAQPKGGEPTLISVLNAGHDSRDR
jgi:hypothetical protein